MTSCSRLVLGFLNALALTFSIFQIIYSLINDNHSANNKQYNCYRSPSSRVILMISYFLLTMSLIGLLSSFCKSNNALQLFYLWVVLISAIVAITATVFMLALLPKGSPNATWQKSQSQNGNWIGEFSPLIRRALVSDDKWIAIRSCLAESGLCESFRDRSINPIWKENLRFLEVSSLLSLTFFQQQIMNSVFALIFFFFFVCDVQLGCCFPPKRCSFVQKNETLREIPKNSGIVSEEEEDSECRRWEEESKEGKYCYDCDSCKAGYLSKFQRDWKADKGIYIAVIAILIVATFLSCYSSNFDPEEKDNRSISKAHQRIV